MAFGSTMWITRSVCGYLLSAKLEDFKSLTLSYFLVGCASTIFRYFSRLLKLVLSFDRLESTMKFFFATSFCLSALFGFSQSTRIVNVQDLINLIDSKSDKIQVINFWATWCGPCVKELPTFEKLNKEKSANIKVTLVSMDLDLDPDPSKVYKFIERKQIKSDVLLLEEKDSNTWINRISNDWSGALPATLLVNSKSGKKKFIEKPLSEKELQNLILEIQ